MPIYEYQCDACAKVHEVTQKFSDSPLTTCPVCNNPVRKLISLSSFALKGSGFYTTDYKRAVQKQESTSSSSAPASCASSGGGCGKSECSSSS